MTSKVNRLKSQVLKHLPDLPGARLRPAAESQALAKGLRHSKTLAASTKNQILQYVASAQQVGGKLNGDAVTKIGTLANAILASDFSNNMESWLSKTFNEGVPTIYDKAADAVYSASHIGGGQLHRLFDGNHTVWGMWEKVKEASPDDSKLQELWGFLTAYGKDLSSSVGMPLFSMSAESYGQVSDYLTNTFHIPKPWFQDLLHVNGVEVLGTSIAAIALALRWNKADTAEFSRLVGGLGISAVVSANPALGVLALATLAKPFTQAREKGDYMEVVDGLAKGGVGTGIFLATSVLIPGPVWVGILAGLCVGVVVNRATDNVRVSELGEFVGETIRTNLETYSGTVASAKL